MIAANCTPVNGLPPMTPYLGGGEEGGHGWTGVGPAHTTSREEKPQSKKFRIPLERVTIETTDVVVEAADAVAAWESVHSHKADWTGLQWRRARVDHPYISGPAEITQEAPTPWPTNQ